MKPVKEIKLDTGCLIEHVSPGSPADAAGIKADWKLMRIDNRSVKDIIEYKIMEADDNLLLLLRTNRGTLRRVRIKKEVSQPLGLTFDPPTIAKMKHCGNNCIFCFIDQNPLVMRPLLYIKDDDYRLSFLFGNFITLNNIGEREIERIIKLQLSPLYVSVHSTNPTLRSELLGTKKALRGLSNLYKLVNNGIRIHAQIVICPGLNDGTELERTVNDLHRLGINLGSVALVPVGLTKHRSGLRALKKLNVREAKALVSWLKAKQKHFLQKRGSRFVFAADEVYLLAGEHIPEDEEYEGYPQLENGVGLVRHFLNELEEIEKKEKLKLPGNLEVIVAGGRVVLPLLKKLQSTFSALASENLKIEVLAVENDYFGSDVSVSGLLTGSDLLKALKGKRAVDGVFISKSLIKDNSNIFLDGLTISDLERELDFPLFPVSGPLDMLKQMRLLKAGKNKMKGRHNDQ